MGDELRDQLMVDIRQVWMGAPGNEGQRIIGEVAYQRFVHCAVGGVVHGVSIERLEALDVLGYVGDRETQHLRRRVVAFGPTSLLESVRTLEVDEQHVDEQ